MNCTSNSKHNDTDDIFQHFVPKLTAQLCEEDLINARHTHTQTSIDWSTIGVDIRRNLHKRLVSEAFTLQKQLNKLITFRDELVIQKIIRQI